MVPALYLSCVVSGFVSTSFAYVVVIHLLDKCKSSFRTMFYFTYFLLSSILFFVLTSCMKAFIPIVEDKFIFINVMFNLALFFAFLCCYYVYIFDITKEDTNARFAKVTALTTVGLVTSMPILLFID